MNNFILLSTFQVLCFAFNFLLINRSEQKNQITEKTEKKTTKKTKPKKKTELTDQKTTKKKFGSIRFWFLKSETD